MVVQAALRAAPAAARPVTYVRQRRTMVVSALAGPAIMVNSCTGKMGHSTAEAVVRAGITLVPYSFTGQSEAVAVGKMGVSGIPVELVGPEERQAALDHIRSKYPELIVVDYTLPAVLNENATFYCENKLPFVMGTTGGDRDKLLADVAASGNYAVIAPNMGKQIVAFQTMMEMMAERFPGCFSGYTLQVAESHQRTKVDTSGTAKAVVASLNKMGLPYGEDQIEKVRDPAEQASRMRVPESAIDSGHAFHTYTVASPDGSVVLEFKHNVCGREVYAEGTVDACLFLHRQVQAAAEKKLYNMIDVLTAGAMR
ncbi:4-hydroxy-tetrahydrodipicolinate reductase chloroplastic [Micractinium conductrix]|uniref:4-hydroxy-tetrahydrodipicolinate reductase n=1 Tax=Micractinium conductrix TaxID=554055 RepID=A0A2P6VCW4_9CHLO|nr:4-hydroxy-tetrahydrodipicolinate reductase chloroplastic [Micractinium conductrix]|eukprot:PSC71924.1 4-hydroxy-tetrahydrodipicolinate reductase chloroplastic [Micractinium conductrix]